MSTEAPVPMRSMRKTASRLTGRSGFWSKKGRTHRSASLPPTADNFAPIEVEVPVEKEMEPVAVEAEEIVTKESPLHEQDLAKLVTTHFSDVLQQVQDRDGMADVDSDDDPEETA